MAVAAAVDIRDGPAEDPLVEVAEAVQIGGADRLPWSNRTDLEKPRRTRGGRRVRELSGHVVWDGRWLGGRDRDSRAPVVDLGCGAAVLVQTWTGAVDVDIAGTETGEATGHLIAGQPAAVADVASDQFSDDVVGVHFDARVAEDLLYIVDHGHDGALSHSVMEVARI